MEQSKKGLVSIYDIAVFLLVAMTSVVVITQLFFLLGIEISVINIILALFTASIYTYYLKKDKRETLKIILSAVVISIICILFSTAVYDSTWDGAAYHKQAVGLLKEGWNPIYQTSTEFNSLIESIPYNAEGPMFWAEVYPKASWYFAASIYKITGNIESG